MLRKQTIILLFLIFALLLPPRAVRAEGDEITPWDIISYVNDIRASNGLRPLTVNDILMSTAQNTAQQMVDQNLSWHIGSTSERVKSAGYGGSATVWATENFAVDVDSFDTLKRIWADDLHMIPMLNPIYCDIGVGIATNGENTYYVLHAAYTSRRYCGEYKAPWDGKTPESGDSIIPNPITTEDAETSGTQVVAQWMAPVLTVTPNADGELLHEVQYGQALWSIAIAYNTKMDEIRKLNFMWGEDSTVYVGQSLLIPTPTNGFPERTPTITPTPKPLSPVVVSTNSQPTATKTEMLSLTQTAIPSLTIMPNGSGGKQNDIKTQALPVVLAILVIAIATVALTFWKKPPKPPRNPEDEDPLTMKVDGTGE
ncbi:MAG: LysM peptidoglycan-binding domain-containing protein [Anaerolineaceae bacterium]|nr:LysM peptidoglycan-binding domain-containing protein [Anaerolineaceae bacterium]